MQNRQNRQYQAAALTRLARQNPAKPCKMRNPRATKTTPRELRKVFRLEAER